MGPLMQRRDIFSSIFDPEFHDCIKETFSIEELGIFACRGLNLQEIEYYKNGKKALELINAYKFDKMTQSECGKSYGNWVEDFFEIYQHLYCQQSEMSASKF